MARIPLVGLTGGIGAGKSTALSYLSELGAGVISSDALVHDLLAEAAIQEAIVERLGVATRDAAGGLDRAAIARHVFADDEELAWLEAILHPRVRRAIALWRTAREAAQPAPALLVAEVPLLFEAGFGDDFDLTLTIAAPLELRQQRLAAGLGADEVARRSRHQLSDDERATRSDLIFVNDGSRERLCEYLAGLVAELAGGERR